MSKAADDLMIDRDEDNGADIATEDSMQRSACDFLGFCEHKIALVTAPNEEKLRASLLHQLLLTSEASHRVKNSLQLVSSLLRLQSEASENDELKRGLSDAQTRIMAIAQVHHRIGRTNDVDNIDLSQLVKELCEELQRLSLRCELVVGTDAVFGSPALANSLVLIISELVTNACKYAYPNVASGVVWVDLRQTSSEMILTIRDEGCGLPVNFEPLRLKSLGMRLVYSLVQQLRGWVSVTSDGGTCFIISIPRS